MMDGSINLFAIRTRRLMFHARSLVIGSSITFWKRITFFKNMVFNSSYLILLIVLSLNNECLHVGSKSKYQNDTR